LPGQSNYYTTLSGLNRSGLKKATLFEGLQVAKHPQFGYRAQVGIFEITGKTPAAFGTTYANLQFGAGGLPQMFIPDYSGLQLIKTIPLK
jgi:toxin YxiD